MRITVDEITQNCTEDGGYTRAQIEALGEPWPALKGWKHRCAARNHTSMAIEAFLRCRSRAESTKVRKESKKARKSRPQQKPPEPTRVVMYVEGSHVASKEFLATFAWRSLRYEILKSLGAKCMCCGATPDDGAVMNVDHIKPRKLFPELALDRGNLQILCNVCNHGKGNSDAADFRSITQRSS